MVIKKKFFSYSSLFLVFLFVKQFLMREEAFFLCCGWSPRVKLLLNCLERRLTNDFFLAGHREQYSTRLKNMFWCLQSFFSAILFLRFSLQPCVRCSPFLSMHNRRFVFLKLCTAIVSCTFFFIPHRNHDWIISCLFFFVRCCHHYGSAVAKIAVGELRLASERFFKLKSLMFSAMRCVDCGGVSHKS
jgi:hypothetical protein